MEVAASTLSLTWYEIILCKVIKNTSETRYTLDQYGVDYLMKLYEYLCFEEYTEALYAKDSDIKRGNAQKAAAIGQMFNKIGA